MRGTHPSARPCAHYCGIIPAYAGNTSCRNATLKKSRDHPRVCGEHNTIDQRCCGSRGSSPRMRGTRDNQRHTDIVKRIIPAYAGNTTARNASAKDNRDHPRVCGEHLILQCLLLVFQGSSPRMRGTLKLNKLMEPFPGIIPAYAGNTSHVRDAPKTDRDHPRVCGEHLEMRDHVHVGQGSSPRMRGTRS